jgi:hypothetical protein
MVHGRAGVIGLAVAVFVVAIASSSYATYLEKAAEQAAQAAAKAAERAKDLAAQKAERRRIDKEERERGWNKRRKDQWVNDDFDMPMLQVIDLPPPHEARLEPLGRYAIEMDYKVIMSNLDFIHRTYNASWPVGTGPGGSFTMADQRAAMVRAEESWDARVAMQYSVQSINNEVTFGNLFFKQTDDPKYDMELTLWVTEEKWRKGFHKKLLEWAKKWLADFEEFPIWRAERIKLPKFPKAIGSHHPVGFPE